ncbi:MAG: imidazoleglycerol-phosphate dehydratase HisB [Christensenellales bacterium]|jgi:imidazoleglycerol-phosphate dehydratase
MKTVKLSRETRETRIALELSIYGKGKGNISTGVGFFDHMLQLFAAHGGFDLLLTCAGDTYVDGHHTVEDCGILLGRAFREAMEDKRGLTRYGSLALPMDEALVLAAVDLSGRGGYYGDLPLTCQRAGDFDTESAEEFFLAFAREAGITLHIRLLTGKNTHHILEGAFKAAARALSAALSPDLCAAGRIPSTKGTLL